MTQKRVFVAVAALALLTLASAAQAQPSVMDRRWSVDVGIGWDNGVTGNINSGGIGTIDNQAVVILANPYDKVYGTGVQLRFGGGYMIDEVTEVRAIFTYQSLDANLTTMGDIGTSKLYAQYDPYRSFALDAGFRRYVDVATNARVYAEATMGLGFISETDVMLVAPTVNLAQHATDFYDRTAAFSFGGNLGLLLQTSERVGVYGQVGMRWLSGMSTVDGLAGTGLESINDKSSRWTLPFIIGIRTRF
jgi:opacity protein-like surface antigen